jgi:hypothetical protein
MRPGNYRRDLADIAEERGWAISVTAGNHYKLTKCGIRTVVFASGSPGDHRSLLNIVAKMRRAEQEAANTNSRSSSRASLTGTQTRDRA